MNKNLNISIIIAVLIIGSAYLFSKHSRYSSVNTVLWQELLSIENTIATEAGKKNFLKQSNNLTQKVDPELVDLDSQIVSCDADVSGIASGKGMIGGSCVSSSGINANRVAGKYMGGQCCSALTDTKEYHNNLEKLQAYRNMPDIPLDPMHTPVAMAKMWIDYDKATPLTPDEQKTYDMAYADSKEKPCCCKCWHYYVNEGVAKKMIKNDTFTAQQIAAYWDASDICGA